MPDSRAFANVECDSIFAHMEKTAIGTSQPANAGMLLPQAKVAEGPVLGLEDGALPARLPS